MARLLGGLQVRVSSQTANAQAGAEQVPEGLVSDGSVTDLPAGDRTLDFIYAIEVFRYLDTADNGASRDLPALKPGGTYFGTM
jgi:hypothetical protein